MATANVNTYWAGSYLSAQTHNILQIHAYNQWQGDDMYTAKGITDEPMGRHPETGRLLYKVLSARKYSQNGGYFDWLHYLTAGDEPGEWTIPEEPIMCQQGWHLTDEPSQWMDHGSLIFRAEGRGAWQMRNDKVCFEQVRLIRPSRGPYAMHLARIITDYDKRGPLSSFFTRTAMYLSGGEERRRLSDWTLVEVHRILSNYRFKRALARIERGQDPL